MKIVREERHLAINVVHSPRTDEPSTSEFQPRMALSDLKYRKFLLFWNVNLFLYIKNRSLGFHSFLRELFVGPEPVIRYLCKMYRVHNIPVGDQRAYENFGVIRDQYGTLFPTFFGGVTKFSLYFSSFMLKC
jgi:hypothetical protein